MRIMLLASAICVLAGDAFAQDGATFDNPTPVNFDQPFLYDAVKVKFSGAPDDKIMPVQIIGVDGLRDVLAPRQPRSIEQFLRENPRLTAPASSDQTPQKPEAKDSATR